MFIITTLNNDLSGIPEIDSNGSGTYFKFPNGMLICARSISQQNVTWEQWGSIYSSVQTFGSGMQWAHEFIGTPYVFITIHVTGAACWVGSLTGSSNTDVGTCRVYRPNNPGTTDLIGMNVIAIGKWK